MARGLTSAVKTELATGNIRPVNLYDINFATPLYLTDCSYNLTSSVSGTSRTYTASGHVLGISDAQEGSKPIRNSLTLVLSGVDQSFISIALNENIISSTINIYRGLLNSSNSLIADPFQIFKGFVNEYAIEDDTQTARLTLNISSHWGNFEKVSGRRTSDNSQQRFFSGDKGFEFSALTVQDIKWGRE
tara:strand:+ start:33 stop:599 length:567 start_codon:yes stop_codon:yes gene_type:complete